MSYQSACKSTQIKFHALRTTPKRAYFRGSKLKYEEYLWRAMECNYKQVFDPAADETLAYRLAKWRRRYSLDWGQLPEGAAL